MGKRSRLEKNIQPTSGGAAVATRNLWILNSWQDLILFVLTPVLIIPVVNLARMGFRLEDIALFVAAFGALGHHLPGMMRAYGDSDLFARFKTRLIVSPIFLLSVCFGLAYYDMVTLTLVVLLWGFWHAFMQLFGFVRMYDAKVGVVDRVTANIDFYLCFGWFGAGLLYSPGRMGLIFEMYYKAGGWVISQSAFAGFFKAWMGVTLVLTAVYIVNHIRLVRAGTPPSSIKVLLLVTSVIFWWYALVMIDSIILGVALWEIFHDVQYLAIVWIFNRSQVEKGGRSAGAFTRFLFRRSGAMVGLYLGLIAAYGSLTYLANGAEKGNVKNVLEAILAASTLLHFYFDGFIWKMRERENLDHIGLKGGQGEKVRRVPMWMNHGLKWMFFVVPVAWFSYSEAQVAGPGSVEEASFNAIGTLPKYWASHNNTGTYLERQGKLDEAIEHYRMAIENKPDYFEAHFNLGNALKTQGNNEESLASYEAALEIDPDRAEVHNNIGTILRAKKEYEQAVASFRKALELDEDHAKAQYNLAVTHDLSGNQDAALLNYERALKMNPDMPEALNGAAWIFATRMPAQEGDRERGVQLAERAANLTRSSNPQIVHTLGVAYAGRGILDKAIMAEKRALELARQSNNAGLVQDIERRLSVYEKAAANK